MKTFLPNQYMFQSTLLRRVVPISRRCHRRAFTFCTMFFLNNDITTRTLQGFQVSAWNLVGSWTVPWSRSLIEMGTFGLFCMFHRNLKFSHIGFNQVWETLYWSNPLRTFDICLKFSGLMHSKIAIVIWNKHNKPISHIPQNFLHKVSYPYIERCGFYSEVNI